MEELNINFILKRNNIYSDFKNILNSFELNKNDKLIKKAIYIYGNSGIGKTMFVTNLLKELDYDIIKYDAGDIRNTTVIEDITKHNTSDTNVMSLLNKKKKKKTIVMDEIDGMNSGDKGGINALIKLIRPKKTKKQKLEDCSINPIICIGNYHVDKKIKELMKVCITIELNTPCEKEILQILQKMFPNMDKNIQNNICKFSQGDLRKLNSICKIYKSNPSLFISKKNILDLINEKTYNDNAKKTTQMLFENKFDFDKHSTIINDTDRTSIGLLWHENIIEMIDKIDKKKSIPFYIKQLENLSFADYIDRVTFQNQIWQFNEMSSIIKTFYNHKLFHDFYKTIDKKNIITDIRFTKVLTKYSTEYNNILFIQKLCQKLGMDKKDLHGYFLQLKMNMSENEIYELLNDIEITKLDINRLYKYLEKYTKEDAVGLKDTSNDCDIDMEIDIDSNENTF